MEEILLGGVAGPSVGRRALGGDTFKTGFGYGVYFTDSRIIGLSYKRMLARSFYPAYLVFLGFFALLVSALVLARMAGIPEDQPLPLVFGPIIALLPISLILLDLRPRQVGKRIGREAPVTLSDLANQTPDVVIEREEIAQVAIDGYGIVSPSIRQSCGVINILTKSGRWFTFLVKVPPRLYSKPLSWEAQSGQLIEVLRKFCSQEPPVPTYVKQKRQWNPLFQTGLPS